MNARNLSYLKMTAAVAVVAIAGWMAVSAFRSMSRRGDGNTRVWFYDESEKELYAMPVSTMAPDKGIGGPSGDGYRAIVVGFGDYKHDKSKRKIAYLEKYAPELKKILDEVMLTRALGHIFKGQLPSPQSEYFQSNTLVKRPGENDWHPINTEEGHRIMNEWRSWRGTDGEGAVICAVD